MPEPLERIRHHYLVYARLPVHRQRVAAARAIVRTAATLGPCAVMFSGGKDSLALLHLAREVLPGVPAFFIDSGAETAWTHETVAAMRQRGYRIETVYPQLSIVEMAQLVGWMGYDGPERLPGEWHWRPEDWKCVLVHEPAERIVAMGYPVHLLGLRAQESRGRLMNRRARGAIYPRRDGEIIATPLADWRHEDVFAYVFTHDLPLSREYLDPMDTAEERGRRRTGTALGTTTVMAGRWHELRTRHPELWQRLVAMFPDMRLWG